MTGLSSTGAGGCHGVLLWECSLPKSQKEGLSRLEKRTYLHLIQWIDFFSRILSLAPCWGQLSMSSSG